MGMSVLSSCPALFPYLAPFQPLFRRESDPWGRLRDRGQAPQGAWPRAELRPRPGKAGDATGEVTLLLPVCLPGAGGCACDHAALQMIIHRTTVKGLGFRSFAYQIRIITFSKL